MFLAKSMRIMFTVRAANTARTVTSDPYCEGIVTVAVIVLWLAIIGMSIGTDEIS